MSPARFRPVFDEIEGTWLAGDAVGIIRIDGWSQVIPALVILSTSAFLFQRAGPDALASSGFVEFAPEVETIFQTTGWGSLAKEARIIT